MAERDLDRKIRQIAARQHTVFTRAQALAIGFTPPMIRSRTSSGQWIDLRRGLYGIAGAPATWERKAMGARLRAGPEAAVSHLSAARLWGVTEKKPLVIDITVPHGTYAARDRNAVVHQARGFSRADTRVVAKIHVTNIARTLLDVAGVLRESRLEPAVDIALTKPLIGLEELHSYLDGKGRHKGLTFLRAIVADRSVGVPESELEREFLRLVQRFRLPAPDRQQPIGPYRVDFIYREQRLVVEVDGRKSHSSRAAFEADPHRQNELVLAGYRLLRFTWDAIKRTDEVARQLDAALKR